MEAMDVNAILPWQNFKEPKNYHGSLKTLRIVNFIFLIYKIKAHTPSIDVEIYADEFSSSSFHL